MPRIKLKQKSPEFADDARRNRDACACDIDGCGEPGDYRAPKDRSLNAYYRFCRKHVEDYNRAWNYFEGMSESDIQSQIYASLFGDRPTWRYASYADAEEKMRAAAFGFRAAEHAEQARQERERRERERLVNPQTPEGEAMRIMDLSPPLDMDRLKARYKELAKKYHPDVNKDDPEAEEKLKDVNMAYTVLRLAYQKYQESGL